MIIVCSLPLRQRSLNILKLTRFLGDACFTAVKKTPEARYTRRRDGCVVSNA